MLSKWCERAEAVGKTMGRVRKRFEENREMQRQEEEIDDKR